MDLQHQQLQQLTNWLDVTEARIKRMGAQPLGPDLEDVKHQVEEHKVGSCRPVATLIQANIFLFFPSHEELSDVLQIACSVLLCCTLA